MTKNNEWALLTIWIVLIFDAVVTLSVIPLGDRLLSHTDTMGAIIGAITALGMAGFWALGLTAVTMSVDYFNSQRKRDCDD